MRITVAFFDRGVCQEIELRLDEPCTIADAIYQLDPNITKLHDLSLAQFGVWGKLKPKSFQLREGDRVEIYRPLIVDPKTARRNKVKSEPKAR